MQRNISFIRKSVASKCLWRLQYCPKQTEHRWEQWEKAPWEPLLFSSRENITFIKEKFTLLQFFFFPGLFSSGSFRKGTTEPAVRYKQVKSSYHRDNTELFVPHSPSRKQSSRAYERAAWAVIPQWHGPGLHLHTHGKRIRKQTMVLTCLQEEGLVSRSYAGSSRKQQRRKHAKN